MHQGNRNGNLLIVDDNVLVGGVIGEMCKCLGVSSTYAPGTLAALEQIRKRSCQMVLVDYNLGEEDGLVFAQYLQENFPYLTTGICTGNRNGVRARDLDIYILNKPFGLEGLEEFINLSLTSKTPQKETNDH